MEVFTAIIGFLEKKRSANLASLGDNRLMITHEEQGFMRNVDELNEENMTEARGLIPSVAST